MDCCDKINPVHSTPQTAKRPSIPSKAQKTVADDSQPNYN